ncbi:MAG: hypothetical protein J6C37_13335 [Roseburia sp.]|nr:hypothetical protein [Roseburia sp.]
MSIVISLIMILYGIIGGVSTLVLTLGIPVILAWKVYRKVKFNIPLTC